MTEIKQPGVWCVIYFAMLVAIKGNPHQKIKTLFRNIKQIALTKMKTHQIQQKLFIEDTMCKKIWRIQNTYDKYASKKYQPPQPKCPKTTHPRNAKNHSVNNNNTLLVGCLMQCKRVEDQISLVWHYWLTL